MEPNEVVQKPNNLYKAKVHIPGTDAERRIGALLDLDNIDSGTNKPDLISHNGRYSPRLAIELKGASGRSPGRCKGNLQAFQLHYAITTLEEYEKEFGEPFQGTQMMLDWDDNTPTRFREKNIALYYGLAERTDGIVTRDFDRPFSAIKMDWGDTYIFPHKIAFWTVVIEAARKTGTSIDVMTQYIRDYMKRCIDNSHSLYYELSVKEKWQNIYTADIAALFSGDFSGLKGLAPKRMEDLRRVFPEAEDLVPIEIEGPENSRIYVLANPEDKKSFDTMQEVTRENNPEISRIQERRRELRELLTSIGYNSDIGIYANGNVPESIHPKLGIESEQIRELEDLVQWKRDSDIPF